jgi:hypothetical protein
MSEAKFAPGEGSLSAETDPSPGFELRSKPPSPTRGEGASKPGREMWQANQLEIALAAMLTISATSAVL